MLKPSQSDIIVSQKKFQWRQKVTILWAGYNFTRYFLQRYIFGEKYLIVQKRPKTELE